ncbi:MAG: DUF2262 domain-containing protein [Lachnospiraceae bacterium]|nr:DUF2262 domain-containing protein [Lachnospiraceae bacterium]
MGDIIKDEVLGELEYNKYVWVRSMDKTLYGSDVVIRVLVQDENQEGILDVQRKAYQTYLENEEKYINEAPKYILDYYKWNFEEIDRVVYLEPEDQKDTITEKALFVMCKVYFLQIARDGSFGWVFGCSWIERRGFVVLLSEEEPRILMNRDEFRYLHKMNDKTFGLLVHDVANSWKGLTKHSFFGVEENLVIELEGSVEDTITEAQKKAYAEYLEKEEEHFKAFIEVLRATMVTETALPKTLYIDKEGNYGWICYIPWFDKYTGVLLSEETPLIFKNTNLLLKYRKRNNPVVMEDFNDEYSHGNVFVWGEETIICVEKKTHSLEEMLPLIQKLIAFLNKEKDAFVKALIDDGMLALAEEWVSSCEDEAEDSTKERRGYMVDDETAVYLPISEKDFAASLEFDTIDISYDEEAEDISAHIFINCDPDYFADHSIEVYMDSKGNIDVIGLAG